MFTQFQRDVVNDDNDELQTNEPEPSLRSPRLAHS